MPDEDFNGDGEVNAFDCNGDQIINNLTVNFTAVPGLVVQDFVALFPDAINNTTSMDIGGCSAKVVVVNGPTVEIQLAGTVPEHSSLAAEMPIVIETVPSEFVNPIGDCADEIRTQMSVQDSISISIISTDASGAERVRWNLYEYTPVLEEAGFDGGVRFTFEHSLPPDFNFLIERTPDNFPNDSSSNNPATDRRVEIAAISYAFPVVEEEDEASGRLVLVYDYVEAGDIFYWVRQVIENGTSVIEKNEVFVDAPVGTTGYGQTYYGCFPIRWEQFTGFAQYIQLKERVTLECDYSEPVL